MIKALFRAIHALCLPPQLISVSLDVLKATVEVRYENTFDDMVALPSIKPQTAPPTKTSDAGSFTEVRCFSCLSSAYVGRSTGRPTLVWGGALGACFLFVWFLRLYRRFPRKAVEKLHREKPPTGVFCRHTVSISADGFSEETAESRYFHTWTSLHNIAFTPDYIFLYNTPATAHIIPRRELGDDRFLQFRNEIERVRNA